MKGAFSSILIAAMIAAFVAGGKARAQNLPDLVQRVKPSVAFIRTGDACGSGFVIDSSGLVATALHVVEDAQQAVFVQFPGGSPQTAEILAINIDNDLAILRVAQQDLTPLPLADVSSVKVGQDIVLMGYPLCTNPDPTVARGIVSGMNRIAPVGGINSIQLDIAMSHGESGGPVFNSAGEVIGVVDQVRPDIQRIGQSVVSVGQALNYAVPSTVVRGLLKSVTDGPKPQAIGLPLKTIRTEALTYKNSANAGLKTGQNVSCVSPPPEALSISGVHGRLRSPGALKVATWLSVRDDPSIRVGLMVPSSPSTDVDFRREYHAEPRPTALCLNFGAQSNVDCGLLGILCLIPVGFEVTYTIDYKVWSPAARGPSSGVAGAVAPSPSTPVPAPTSPSLQPPPGSPTPSPASPPASAVADPFAIMPGQGIGRITVGMNIAEAIQRIGRPKTTRTNTAVSPVTFEYYWFEPAGNEGDEGGLHVTADSVGAIVRISVWLDARYTLNGALYTRESGRRAKHGVNQSDIESALGTPTRVVTRNGARGEIVAHGLVYSDKGITFWIADDARIVGNAPSFSQFDAYSSVRTPLYLHTEVVEIEVYAPGN